LQITSGGNVLIGSTGIYGGGTTNESELLVVGNPPTADTDRGLISFMDNRAYNTATLGAKVMMGGAYNTAGAMTFFAGLAGLKENTTDGNYAGALALYTRANGAASSERMRITSGGDLYLGNTSFTSSNGADRFMGIYGAQDCGIILQDAVQKWELYVNDDFYITTDATTRLRIRRTDGLLFSQPTYDNTTASAANITIFGDGSMYRSTSSLKYKTDVIDYTKGLSEVMQLRPVSYKGKNDGDKVFAGLIAEEVHDLGLTEFVQYADDDTPDALSYSHMIALLTKAIQEQTVIINELKQKVEYLESK
jgi:hypothetical protein